MGATFLVGVAVNLVGSILINLGTNVMKLGHNRRAALPGPDAARPPVHRLREWQAGVAAFAVGNVANFVSFGYAAQSLLSAIGCVQFVSNVLFATLVLKERATKGVAAATALIVAGCALLVSFGDHSSRVYTARELAGLYREPAYASYLAVGGAVAAGCYVAYHEGRRRVDADHRATAWAAALPVLYSAPAALVGTQSVLLSKALAVLLRATAGGDNQFKGWLVCVMVPAFLLSAVLWITRLNRGLKMFPAMVIVPTLQIAWTLFSIVSGMLYFQEYRDFTPAAAALFACGLLVMFAGVVLLTRCAPPPQPASVAPSAALAAAAAQAKLALAAELEREDSGGGGGGDGFKLAAVPAAAGDSGPRAAGAEEDEPPEDGEAEGAGLLGAGAGVAGGSSGAAAVASADAGLARGRSGALRRAVSSLTRRIAQDFSLDEAAAAKVALGLGDGALPAMSVFGPPVIGLAAGGGGGWVSGDGGGAAPAAAASETAAQGVEMGGAPPRDPPASVSASGPSLPAAAFLRQPAAAAGGINPLANAVAVEAPPRRPPLPKPTSPFADFAHRVESRARGLGTALSSELRAAAGQLRVAGAGADARAKGYSRADAWLEEGGGWEGDEDGWEAAGGGGGGGAGRGAGGSMQRLLSGEARDASGHGGSGGGGGGGGSGGSGGRPASAQQ